MPVVEEHRASEKARFEGNTASNKLSQALLYSMCNRKRRLNKTAVMGTGTRKNNDLY